jgi:hypothetical protein
MNRLLHPLTLLAILLIAGCADTETPPPRKKTATSTHFPNPGADFSANLFHRSPWKRFLDVYAAKEKHFFSQKAFS